MSATLTGSALLTRFYQKYGLDDTTSQARVLEWINEVLLDISHEHPWDFLKFRLKKSVSSGEQWVDLSPQIPAAPSAAIAAGGSLTDGSTYAVKVTFLLFTDSGAREFDSIESQPSAASSTVTGTAANKTINLTAIPTYTDAAAHAPTTIHRRVYLSKDSGAFILSSTITDNTTTTLSITSESSSVIEPPEFPMVDRMAAEDIFLITQGYQLRKTTKDEILKQDPGLSSTGTPTHYARDGRKAFLWPRPSATLTISYFVIKRPSYIFNDSSRVVQLEPFLKPALDAGVVWKGYEYKDQDGQESKRSNYDDAISRAKNMSQKEYGKFLSVQDSEWS